ncbi:aldehyde dehydrogenase family protein [Bacteroidota bacterium]
MKKTLDIDEVMLKSHNASEEFKLLNQKQVDKIVNAVYIAGFNKRVELAKLAREETRLGNWRDKTYKNIIATHFVYNDIKNLKTVGVISEDQENGITEIATPLGPILVITPITNPTSTVLFKILISLKTRNPIVIIPHGAARKSTIEAAHICYEAALEAGVPMDSIQWIKHSSREQVLELMSHKMTALILATGSVSLVRAAYKSGTPTIGVGPGNVPVFFGKTADIKFGVEQIVKSKMFDNGTVCASEQALVLQDFNANEVIAEFKKHKAYFLDKNEIKKLESVAFNKEMKVMNIEVIGQTAIHIAQMADINVPGDTTLLIAQLDEVGIKSPLSLEILAPVLALYIVKDFDKAIEKCKEINKHGGLGHTVSIFSNNIEKIRYFASVMNAGRVIVNTPSSQGALGGLYNSLQPSLTLACGTGGKNITTDNISARHLLNIQRIAWRKETECFEHFDSGMLLDEETNIEQLEDECFKKAKVLS